MIQLKKFTGINNISASSQLSNSELSRAENVDIHPDGSITRRGGITRSSTVGVSSLATLGGLSVGVSQGDLVRVTPTNAVVLQSGVGSARMWYTLLPDGTVMYSNGLHGGVTDGTDAWSLGVSIPPDVGVASSGTPAFSGAYRYAITYVRDRDGAESPPAYAAPIYPVGGIYLTGLPTRAGHSINIYLSTRDGEALFLAGNTVTGTFTFGGTDSDLMVPCRSDHLYPTPVGTLNAFWRGRVLSVQGNVLWASEPHRWGLCDMARNFKQFSHPITAVLPVNGGIYIGTESQLLFLRGDQFDKLVQEVRSDRGVLLGSGVTTDAGDISKEKSTGRVALMIVGGLAVAGTDDGEVIHLTKDRYLYPPGEVCAATVSVAGENRYVVGYVS